MLSFKAATSIVFITSSFVTLSICGPLDWAKVEVPWARADRSKIQSIRVQIQLTLVINFFRLRFNSSYRRQPAVVTL